MRMSPHFDDPAIQRHRFHVATNCTVASGHPPPHHRVSSAAHMSIPCWPDQRSPDTGRQTMTDNPILQRMHLNFNPFEPTAAGPPLRSRLLPPHSAATTISQLINEYDRGLGTKAFTVVGEYGSGKTCLLRWLHRDLLPRRGIKSYYFSNPGVHFYSLADRLLRDIGRKNFAKMIWELIDPHVTLSLPGHLFRKGFEGFLGQVRNVRDKRQITEHLLEGVHASGITSDPEIAHYLARILVLTVTRPYFEYRDFIPRSKDSVVPEKREAQYFGVLLRTIAHCSGARAIAFLIDEFEEIGLQKRVTRRAQLDYFATLRKLVHLADEPADTSTSASAPDFWLALSMTPDALERTKADEPAIMARISRSVALDGLSASNARDLVLARLQAARSDEFNIDDEPYYPFPSNFFARDTSLLRPQTYSNPRQLVKTCSSAIARVNDATAIPFSQNYIHNIEENLYPTAQPDE